MSNFWRKPLSNAKITEVSDGHGPIIRLEDVQKWIADTRDKLGYVVRLGRSKPSWRFKCPYSQPPPENLVLGMKRPETLRFESEADRAKYVLALRKKKTYIHGKTPTWFFIIPNFIVLYFAIFNPNMPWFDDIW